LLYDRSPEAAFVSSPLALLDRWSRMRPTPDAFFTLAEEEDLSASTASHVVATLISALLPRPSDAPVRHTVRALVHTMSGRRYRSPPLGLCIVWDGKASGSARLLRSAHHCHRRLGLIFRSYAPAAMISSPWQGRAGPPGPSPLTLRVV
jgi:hypothetical protein